MGINSGLISMITPAGGKFTCPYCYAEHSIADCGLKCSYNINGKTEKTCKAGVTKYDDLSGYDWIPQANKKKCLDCKEAAKQLFCDQITDKEIPIEFLSMKSLPIALLGAKASGKSNYIGVLVNEIRKKMTRPFNCSLSMTCSRESKEAYDNNYYNPLYVHKRIIGATDSGIIPPLIFPLKFMNEKDRIKNMAALTFYDTAGENLDDRDNMNKYNRYITNARGIILLLDPLQVPKIRGMLTANKFASLPEKNTEIYDVLSRIIDVIKSYKKNIKGRIKIPLALVFTKIDVLEQYNILPEDSSLKEESEHIKRGAFIGSDFENIDLHMRDLIDNWLDDEIFGYLKQFEQYSFFGATALGANPNGTAIDSGGIRPRRVLDPLLWLLAINNYIRSFKK